MASEYKPGQVLTADELNASFDAKTDNAAAAITGGSAEGLDHVYIVGSTDSTSLLTGAMTVTGGVGIGKQLRVGEAATFGKNVLVAGVTQSTSPTTGALIVNGGIGVGGNANIAGAAVIAGNATAAMVVSTDATDATSPTTGALKTAGGAGIAKSLWVGGAQSIGGALSVQGNATVAGTVTAGALTLAAGGQITFPDGSTQNSKPIPDAPSDAKKYGRLNAAWAVLTDIAEAPQDGTKYARRNAAWVTLVDTPDAPNDAFYYGRHGGTWAKVTEEAAVDAFIYGRANGTWAKTVPEAPSDGQQYSRRNAAWQVLSASGLVVGATPPTDTAKFPMWWDTTSGTLFIWYDDGNSAQWVICVPTDAIGAAAGTATWGGITGTLSNQTDLQAALDLKLSDAPTSGESYARKAGAWAIVTSFPEAPNDGKSYARKSAAWAEVLGTAWGGITGTLASQTDLKTALDAKLGDAPLDGQTYGRMSGTWAVVTGGSGGSYLPLAGGTLTGNLTINTGATANPALTVTSAVNGETNVILQSPGSVATWANYIRSQTGGNYYWRIRMGTNANDNFAITRHTGAGASAGIAALQIDRATGLMTVEVDMTLGVVGGGSKMSLQTSTSGGPTIELNKSAIGSLSNIILGRRNSVSRWRVDVGDTTAETGSGNVGSDFAITRYNDSGTINDTPFKISRATGDWLAGTRQIKIVNPAGSGYAGLILDKTATTDVNVISGRKGGLDRWGINLGDNTAESGANAGCDFSINRFNDAGAVIDTPVQLLRASGNFRLNNGLRVPNGDILMGGDNSMGLTLNGTASPTFPRALNLSVGYRLQLNMDTGILYWIAQEATKMEIRTDGTLVISGQGFKPGGGSWADTSDERIKENIVDYASGLAQVKMLRPVNYTFKHESGRDTTKVYTGLIAQDVELHMPEMIKVAPGKVGDIELDDMRTLDNSALIYALVNSVKELNARLEAVEAK